MKMGRPEGSGWGNPSGLRCPNCYSARLNKAGTKHGKTRYQCRKCGTKTVLPKPPAKKRKAKG